MDFDIFNGDADGIFARIQLRKADPRPGAEAVTGVKRDIALVRRIVSRVDESSRVTVLDISHRRNEEAVDAVLEAGATVAYFDHHQTGRLPEHDRFTGRFSTHRIDCTSAIVNRVLGGRHAEWAICGAFGDNFQNLAQAIAHQAKCDTPLAPLRELGELVNYNGYGHRVGDLHYHPADLHDVILPYPRPMDFISDRADILSHLRNARTSDWDIVTKAKVLHSNALGEVLLLPADVASDRVSGLFGNARVEEQPGRAFAILTPNRVDTAGRDDDVLESYRVSIRLPRKGDLSAATLAQAFGGGGRPAAAGIDALDHSDVDAFIERFLKTLRRNIPA